jgi:hypothetical protein
MACKFADGTSDVHRGACTTERTLTVNAATVASVRLRTSKVQPRFLQLRAQQALRRSVAGPGLAGSPIHPAAAADGCLRVRSPEQLRRTRIEKTCCGMHAR